MVEQSGAQGPSVGERAAGEPARRPQPSAAAGDPPPTTTEIDGSEWAQFLRRVDSAARGQLVSIELVGPELGSQVLAHDVSLRGLAYSEGAAPEVEIDVGEAKLNSEHRVIYPVHLYAAENASGALQWLDLEDEEGVKTLISFQPPPMVRVH